MKTKNILLLSLLSFISIASVSADYRIYDNVSDFEKAKGAVCEAATDGCNNYFMSNGKVMGGTFMACPEEQKIEWTCTQYKENIVTTKILETTTVVGGDRDKNGCIGSAGYTWSEKKQKCIRAWEESNLSENDQNFYNTIKDRLDSKYQNAINKIVMNFENKLSKYSEVKQDRMKKIMVDKIEAKISHLLLQYPQDIALPDNINNKYLTYTLLKFELLK